MTCPHRAQSDAMPAKMPANIIDLSQLDCTKPKCPFKEGTCEICQEVIKVENDIKETFERLKQLLRHQQDLKTRSNNTHSPIIRDLPAEILSKIFYSCFSEEITRDDWELAYEDVFVPLKVGAVCRTWRQVAWSSPELWTFILIERLYSSATYVCKQYSMLERWIERSKYQPISVYIYEDAMDSANVGVVPEGCDCWETTLQLLARCCDRWKNATLHLSKGSFKYIASSLKLKSPTKRLELGSADSSWRPNPNNHPLGLWEEPRFGPDSITINRPVLMHHFSIDWKRVTKVDVQGWPPGECINLLKSALRLVSCSFREVGEYSRDSQPEQDWPVVCHASLRSLSFQCGSKPVSSFFDNVTVPSLDEFNYSYVRGHNPADMIANSQFLPSFFSRSHFPLTRLSLVVPALTTDYLVSLLNLVPSLIHLSMHFSTSFSGGDQMKVIDHFLEHLSSTAIFSIENGGDTSAHFLPRLETLELEKCGFNFPWSSLADVFGDPFEPGRKGRRPLKSFVLGTRIPKPVIGLPEDVVQRLVGLQEAGVSLNYSVRSADGRSLVPVTWT
ncbi:hypothetical protein D9613_004470 [Agrocybe pediades]|uniref:F-box domain-containing protein n=1 Tax=Agrocybe pediades TaxID=84607 RepID=A0A8H4QI25_9AGAR|nr:hypothetical protein D9613_004470 [Agrocybe pediades]